MWPYEGGIEEWHQIFALITPDGARCDFFEIRAICLIISKNLRRWSRTGLEEILRCYKPTIEESMWARNSKISWRNPEFSEECQLLTTEQNGTAERKNRTLVEIARCLFLQSGFPSHFGWKPYPRFATSETVALSKLSTSQPHSLNYGPERRLTSFQRIWLHCILSW